MLSMSFGLRVLKSALEMGTPSKINNGAVPELIELVPRIWNTAAFTGFTGVRNDRQAGTLSLQASLKLAHHSSVSDLTVETEPAMVPFLRTP